MGPTISLPSVRKTQRAARRFSACAMKVPRRRCTRSTKLRAVPWIDNSACTVCCEAVRQVTSHLPVLGVSWKSLVERWYACSIRLFANRMGYRLNLYVLKDAPTPHVEDHVHRFVAVYSSTWPPSRNGIVQPKLCDRIYQRL